MEMALESGLLSGTATSREEALSVPAVLRGRNMICNIATLPLVQIDPDRKRVNDSLFNQLDPQVPNVVTLAMTVEDMICDGIGWWEITTRGWNYYPASIRHVDSRRITINPPAGYQNALPSGFDPASTIYVDGKPRHATDFIRFDSPNPPLLTAAARAIKRAVQFENTASLYAEDPRPLDYFTPADGVRGLTDDTVRGILSGWIASRKKRATAFVPETMAYNTVQSPNPQEMQLVGLMQRAALDIANALGVDPEDLGISTTSRTYQNATDRRQDRVNDVLSAYMRAITDRLSMADVTRRGYRVVFDLDDYMRADPTTRWATYQTASDLGVIDAQEIREREDLPGRIPAKAKPIEAPPLPPLEVEDVEIPDTVTNAREGGMQTFNSAPKSVNLRLDDKGTTFSVDAEKRVITGTALVYGQSATNSEGTWTFRDGSVQWNKAAINRVKLLRDHNWEALLGAALSVKEEGGRLVTKFKVARGPAGDQALAEAEDGALDGLSVGLDIHEAEPTEDGGWDVISATLNETSLTPRPAFDDARLTSVAASNTKGNTMPDKTPDAPADLDERIATAVATAMAAALSKSNENPAPKADNSTVELAKSNERPDAVNSAARPTPNEKFAKTNVVKEASPYTFDRAGRFTKGEHEFSTDFGRMLREQDFDGTRTEAGKRVMGHIAQNFVAAGDVNELNPAINRSDLYYNPPGNRTPLWQMVNKGGVPNGVQPFTLPKFSSASGLVADHVEGTEPTAGTFVTTNQTITPTALSGKVSVSREVIDMGGNPAVSNLIWQRMVRSWDEGLESATATFLNTLTAATDITITAGAVDEVLAASVQSAIVALNFTPGYDWEAFAVERELYTRLANAVDGMDRPLFPAINATNANGQASSLFQRLNLNGLIATPAAGLASTAGSPNNSWLFDPAVVHGYASAPQRLEFAGSGADNIYTPVATVDIAIWGYKAFANIDIAGVRQVIYDTVA